MVALEGSSHEQYQVQDLPHPRPHLDGQLVDSQLTNFLGLTSLLMTHRRALELPRQRHVRLLQHRRVRPPPLHLVQVHLVQVLHKHRVRPLLASNPSDLGLLDHRRTSMYLAHLLELARHLPHLLLLSTNSLK